MADKRAYRKMSVAQIVELEDDEERRHALEAMIREHTTSNNQAEVTSALERALEEEADLDETDPDEYLTELLDLSTDDGLAEVLRGLLDEA